LDTRASHNFITRESDERMELHLEELKWRAPKSRGETKLKVSQSQVVESRLGSTLPASNSRKG
jgi:hypothetical protein